MSAPAQRGISTIRNRVQTPAGPHPVFSCAGHGASYGVKAPARVGNDQVQAKGRGVRRELESES